MRHYDMVLLTHKITDSSCVSVRTSGHQSKRLAFENDQVLFTGAKSLDVIPQVGGRSTTYRVLRGSLQDDNAVAWGEVKCP